MKNPTISKTIAIRLNSLLAKNNLTQTELAKQLGFEAKTGNPVNYWLHCKQTPNIERLIQLSKIFNVSIDYLLGLSDAQTKDESISISNATTGLSEKAINNIRKLKDGGYINNFIELTDITTKTEKPTCFSVRNITSFCPCLIFNNECRTEIRTVEDDFFIVKEDYNTVKLMISEAQR